MVLSTAETPANSPNLAAIQFFLTNISNASASFSQDVLPNPDDDFDQFNGGAGEFSLDVEMQSIGSPGAKSITLVVAPASQVFSVGVNYIVNTLSAATAVSVSLGTCEPAVQMYESGLDTSFQLLLQQGLAEGQTWSAASGDDWFPMIARTAARRSAFPASIPEMVAAGGSAIATPSWNAAGALMAYQTETAWNDGDNGGASGGGFSILFPQPPYQQGFTFSGRSVPDIALIAGSPGVLSDNGTSGLLFPVEGTSVASPLSAGFFALIASRVGCRLGDVHQTLYTLGNAQLDGGAKVFHDIVSGTAAHEGVAGPDAGVGYDSVTGWGSLDVQALAEAWPPCAGDAGVAGPAYDPCAILACTVPAVCDTVPDGPSSCEINCDPAGANSCPAGSVLESDDFPVLERWRSLRAGLRQRCGLRRRRKDLQHLRGGVRRSGQGGRGHRRRLQGFDRLSKRRGVPLAAGLHGQLLQPALRRGRLEERGLWLPGGLGVRTDRRQRDPGVLGELHRRQPVPAGVPLSADHRRQRGLPALVCRSRHLRPVWSQHRLQHDDRRLRGDRRRSPDGRRCRRRPRCRGWWRRHARRGRRCGRRRRPARARLRLR